MRPPAPRRRHGPLRGRAALSMIELLMALIMISILMVSAFMSWGSYIDEARVVTTRNRMDGLRKALEAWSADNPRGYPTYDLNPLLGRYIPNPETDGWGNDFVIDRYLLRIISRGRNGILDTPVAGWGESPLGGFGGDDLIQEAQENGRIVMVSNNGLYMVRPDGTYFMPLAEGVTTGDVAPGGGAIIWGGGNAYERDWISSSESIGSYDLTSGSEVGSTVMTWFTDPFGTTGWGTIAIAPDGIHIAGLRSATGVQLIVGELVDPAESVSAPPFLVKNFATGDLDGDELGHIAWGRRSGKLFLTGVDGGQKVVFQVNAAPNSTPTTPVWGAFPSQDTVSVDVCATRDRYTFVRDGKVMIASATGSVQTSATMPTGTPVLASINRKGDAVAVLDDGNNLSIWWPDRPQAPTPGGEGNPFLVVDGSQMVALAGTVRDIHWR